jgi:tetratricopeptide (TPR) repeat protein
MENQASFLDYLLGTGVVVAAIAVFGWLIVSAVRHSEDPGKLISRMVASLVVVPILLLGFKSNSPLFLFLCFLLSGAIMACFWTSYITAAIAKPFSNLYSGGDIAAERRPFYSMAEGKRNTGRYLEAIAEIRAELAKFPNDFKGQMMLAEIQAENLKEVGAAQETLQAMLAQPGHEPKNVAYAMNRLADWHLKIDKDVEAAKEAVQWILQMFPDTEAAYQATQRLAHMDKLVSGGGEAQRFVVKEQTQHIALENGFDGIKPAPEDFQAAAAALLNRLEAQPDDNETREQLAVLYARQFHRMDMATELIEQMLAQSGVPTRHRVHWLNLLADLQITVAADAVAARKALQRIIDTCPGTVDVEKATQRMLFIERDIKNQKAGTTFQMGEYDQNIGLKNPQYPSTPKSHD